MKSNTITRTFKLLSISIVAGFFIQLSANASNILDDFSNETLTNTGSPRLIMDDASLGGKSNYELKQQDGVLKVTGKIQPARGQPGFVSMVLLIDPQGKPSDLSAYEGLQLSISVKEGNVSVLAASAEITNYDFHASPLTRNSGGLQVVQVPFDSLKRIWSEQTALNLKTISSINVVASALQPQTFEYEIDEISFY